MLCGRDVNVACEWEGVRAINVVACGRVLRVAFMWEGGRTINIVVSESFEQSCMSKTGRALNIIVSGRAVNGFCMWKGCQNCGKVGELYTMLVFWRWKGLPLLW